MAVQSALLILLRGTPSASSSTTGDQLNKLAPLLPVAATRRGWCCSAQFERSEISHLGRPQALIDAEAAQGAPGLLPDERVGCMSLVDECWHHPWHGLLNPRVPLHHCGDSPWRPDFAMTHRRVGAARRPSSIQPNQGPPQPLPGATEGHRWPRRKPDRGWLGEGRWLARAISWRPRPAVSSMAGTHVSRRDQRFISVDPGSTPRLNWGRGALRKQQHRGLGLSRITLDSAWFQTVYYGASPARQPKPQDPERTTTTVKKNVLRRN